MFCVEVCVSILWVPYACAAMEFTLGNSRSQSPTTTADQKIVGSGNEDDIGRVGEALAGLRTVMERSRSLKFSF